MARKQEPSATENAGSNNPHQQDFESAVAELEALVEQMESGALNLADSLAAYKRGAVLVKQCRDTLAKVEQEVRILEGDLLKPFDDADAEA